MTIRISNLLSVSLLAVIGLSTQLPSWAQANAPTNWELNQQAAINQDVAAGALRGNQAANLENREAQIQMQQQQYMNQNGGTLNSQERHQIDSELRGVRNHMNRDLRNDGAANGMMGMPFGAANMQNGYPQGQWQRPMWQNNMMGGVPGAGQWQNAAWSNQMMNNPQQFQAQNAYQQQLQNQQNYPHHHHHEGFGGNLFGGNGNNVNSNGYNGSNPGFGGGFNGGGWHQ